MLKSRKDGRTYLVSQPDHARVAGFFAAHWGNTEFARPAYFGESDSPERLRAETVLAIAEHDNGWWEWEAVPVLAQRDGFPKGLADLLEDQQEGMNRWRLGVPRLAQQHPYVSLLISYHAYWYWLYVHGCEDNADPAFRHPLFRRGSPRELMGGKLEAARQFIRDMQQIQQELSAHLRQSPALSSWVNPEHLKPHVRLLQIIDALSLSLSEALVPPRQGVPMGLGEDEFDLLDVPRKGWADRTVVEVKPVGRRRIVCTPYPFDVDPLPVSVPARVFDSAAKEAESFGTWWHAQAAELIRFEYASQST